MKTKDNPTRIKRHHQMALAKAVAGGNRRQIGQAMTPFRRSTIGWRIAAAKFDLFLRTGVPQFGILVLTGNKKLPFAKFSTLPIFTCPGADACKIWCYSFAGWRFPSAFFGQCQNTILMADDSPRIAQSVMQLKENCRLRLYVDGDFSSAADIRFWMSTLKLRPDVRAYGYSKSWLEFLQLDESEFAPNYLLNLSSGGRFALDSVVADAMRALPVTRGGFIAAPIAKEHDAPIGSRTVAYRRATRESAAAMGHERSFVCPGLCGTCTAAGPACGEDRFRGVDISIAIH